VIVVILVIAFIQLCGSEDSPDPEESTEVVPETATLGPTFTPGPSPTAGETVEPPTEVAGEPTIPEGAPGTESERDAVRQTDLLAIQAALEEYFAEEDEYPSTDGGVQSLCVFEDFDVGCELQDYLDPIPEDPLGEPSQNGYFYSSDGQTYTVYAIRESDDILQCAEHPEHITATDTVLCVTSP
jgi:hypothetical protein